MGWGSWLKNIAKVGSAFIPGVGPLISAGLTAADANGWMGGGGGGGSSFNPLSPEADAEGGGGGTDWSKLLLNPLTVGLGGSGLSGSLNGGNRRQASQLTQMQMALLKQLLTEQQERNTLYSPLRTAAGTGITNMLKPGSGSMLSPEGRTRYKLPEYTPGQRVNIGRMRSGFKTLPAPQIGG